jgi:hypothetical protein
MHPPLTPLFAPCGSAKARAHRTDHDVVRAQYLAQAKAFEMRGYSYAGGHGSPAYRIMDAAYRDYHGKAFGARV